MSARNKRLRQLLSGEDILMAPGAHDALTARIAEMCGFDAVYMTGAGTVNTQLGMPDHSIITLTEMVQSAARLAKATSLPIVSDADTGYGGVLNVMRTVKEFESAGVSGIHLEDQVMPKRCGHLQGKEIITVEEMTAKIRAACHARTGPDFVIIARVDARGPLGFDEAVKRGHAYLEAGADMIFPEALESEAEFRSYAKGLAAPLLANMTEFGKTPFFSAAQFREMGYRMVIFPASAMRVAIKAVYDLFSEIRRTGTQQRMVERMFTRQQLYELLDYDGMLNLETRFAEKIPPK
ncbi:MAG: methylisocitrate lyase [Deltaproteobacteria bacterium]|nr:methylisocitrate lyase [Deltaproteobacteria bacterium]